MNIFEKNTKLVYPNRVDLKRRGARLKIEYFIPLLQDFASNFTTLEICDVTPEVFEYDNDSDDDSSSDEDEEGQRKQQQNVQRRWQRLMFEGAWVSHHTAGGCRNFIRE